MIDQIIFDTTDADTIADSHKILAGLISTDGSTLLTDTAGSGANTGKQGQDVFVINNDFDVNLQAGDGTDITQTGGALDVNIAGGNITITEEDVYEEDSAHTSGDKGAFNLSIRMEDITADNSALLAGTDGDYQGTFTNDSGELYVKATDTDNLLTTIDSVLDSIKVDTGAIAVDVAAIETELLDQGTTLDNILTDTNAMVVDLAAIEVEQLAQGLTLDSIDTTLSTGVTVSDAALADTAIANAVNTLAAANTAEDVVASPLADRKYLYVYNNDNKKIYVGASGVSAANGFPVSPGSYLELRAGASVDIEWVSSKLAHDIRTLELS